jgi:hypothetical protein
MSPAPQRFGSTTPGAAPVAQASENKLFALQFA